MKRHLRKMKREGQFFGFEFKYTGVSARPKIKIGEYNYFKTNRKFISENKSYYKNGRCRCNACSQGTGFLFAYASQRIPEITETVFAIDESLKNGFAWEFGPFETWDAIGFEAGLKLIEESGEQPADWILSMKAVNKTQFYTTENRQLFYYDHNSENYLLIPGQQDEIRFHLFDKKRVFIKMMKLFYMILEMVYCV